MSQETRQTLDQLGLCREGCPIRDGGTPSTHGLARRIIPKYLEASEYGVPTRDDIDTDYPFLGDDEAKWIHG